MQPIFSELPFELLEAIVAHVHSKKDRRSLWRVSRRFYEVLTPLVFETLTIRAEDRALHELDARPYDKLDDPPTLLCLRSVRNLHLRAPFRFRLLLEDDKRCHHDEMTGDLPRDPLTRIRPRGAHFRLPKLIQLSLQLQENGLISFSWDLGMCIPEHVLGPEGYLTKKQTSIESLSLITGTDCCAHWRQTPAEDVVLSGFSKLRKFSWTGLHLTEELNSLRDFFRSNRLVLENLELDFIVWATVWIDGRPPEALFTELILPHGAEGTVQRFQLLNRLSLTAFAFEESTEGFNQAFNVENLQSLTLRNCVGILTFLRTIVDQGAVMRLKSLEIMFEDDAVENDDVLESALIKFLQSFQGLEHFYLTLRDALMTPNHWHSYYWDGILHHSSTLRNLVYHGRMRDPSDHTNPWDDDWADTRLYVPPDDESDHAHSMENHFYNAALAQMKLERFGVADRPENVASVMSTSLAVAQSFKLLHIRRTATDPPTDWYTPDRPRFEDQIRALAKHDPVSWSRQDYLHKYETESHLTIVGAALSIFQSPKFDALQVLAFGDFSHGGRYKRHNILLCRATTPNPEVRFRVMWRDDVDFYMRSGLLSMDFLAACPRNSLYEYGENGEYP